MRSKRWMRWAVLAAVAVVALSAATPDVAHADMLSGTCDASAGYTGCTDGTVKTAANLWLFTTIVMTIIIQSI